MLSGFLALHPIAPVTAELEQLRQAALEALSDLADGVEIETTSLLRRQVARRCIYGVDLNHISVELARLAIWIHTFVPGLPLSFLDHSLVCGNSLTGIGTIDEAIEILDPNAAKAGAVSLFRSQIDEFLGRASDALRRLARVTDATVADVEAARKAHLEAVDAVRPARDLFDLLVAGRLGEADMPVTAEEERIDSDKGRPCARELAKKLQAMHFPVAFPEVFLRTSPGFDCIVGNPPWEKLHVDERAFWALRFPGLRSMPVAQLNREMARLRKTRPDLVREYDTEVESADLARSVLLRGPYPDLGSGHPDLYKAFSWRFWQLIRDRGFVGVVLPRAALSAAGSVSWREAVLNSGSFYDVTLTTNTGGWVFDDAEHRYTIGFVALRRKPGESTIRMRGPYASMAAYRSGKMEPPVEFDVHDFRGWTTGAAFPLVPTTQAAAVFLKMRKHPRLDVASEWQIRLVQGDLNATTGKDLMVLEPDDTSGLWPVYKGASFNLWTPDTSEYYAWADPAVVVPALQSRREQSARRSNSGFGEFSADWIRDVSTLPCRNPRISYRRIARATDTRTVIACLVPPNVVLTDKASYMLRPRGDEHDEALLLGVMSSIPFDWYARRIVEIQLDFHVLLAFPVPRPARDDRIRTRAEAIAGRLAAVEDRYETWAEVVGASVGPTSSDEHQALVAELDAAVAYLYGLKEDDLKVVFETFHVGWDFSARLAAVLEHFREMA